MNRKAPLALMEQLVMVLVFALAAAVCIQAFVLAGRNSSRCAIRDRAVISAQSMAEVYKSCRGDEDQAAKRYGGHVEQGAWVTYWDHNGKQVDDFKDAGYQIKVVPDQTQSRYLGHATLKASETDKNSRFSFVLNIAWQEVDDDA